MLSSQPYYVFQTFSSLLFTLSKYIVMNYLIFTMSLTSILRRQSPQNHQKICVTFNYRYSSIKCITSNMKSIINRV